MRGFLGIKGQVIHVLCMCPACLRDVCTLTAKSMHGRGAGARAGLLRHILRSQAALAGACVLCV